MAALLSVVPLCRFLDFGLMCQMERRHQLAMLASIIHIVNGDWASLVHALSEMDVVRPGTNIRLVTMVLQLHYVHHNSNPRPLVQSWRKKKWGRDK